MNGLRIDYVVSLHATVRHLPDPDRADKAICSWSAVQNPAPDISLRAMMRLPLCRNCERRMAQATR